MPDGLTACCEQINSKYIPPKKWKELTDSEKIERTRMQLRELMRSVENTNNQLYKIGNLLRKHKHLDNIVVEEINVNSGGEILKRAESKETIEQGDCYF